MEALHMLETQARSRSARYIFESLVRDVSNGQLLSTALAKFRTIFGGFCINIVKVGETSGTLHENLEYLAEELKKQQALKRRVVGALVYPAIIVAATIAIVLMLLVYIFPKIIPIFTSVRATLPLSTRLLIALSNFVEHYGLIFFALALLLLIGLYLLRRFVPRFRYALDTGLLSFPILGALARDYNVINTTRSLSLLLRSDVGVIHALELVAASTRNQAYRRALRDAAKRITRGQTMSQQLTDAPRLFPPLVAQMVAVGESTGNLSDSLMFLSDIYEEEVSEMTKNLTTMLEPILMIIMGIIVGFIAVSIITPIYSITQSLNPK